MGDASRAAAVPSIPVGLSLAQVSVRIGRRTVVRDVSASVEAGGWLTVVGANGAGKSTLLRAIAGLVAHDGEVHAGSQRLTGSPPRRRARHLALVVQTPILPPTMRVSSYVLLGRVAHLGPLARESRADLDIVTAVLERLDARSLADRPLATLSGGEAQRVTIARALVQQAPVLLLDEPTSSLDIGHQLEVLDLVDELRRERGLTVVATMHDLTLAAQYAERLLLLDDGAVAAAGTPAEVLTEEHLTRYYRAAVRIVREGDTVVVVPVRQHGVPGCAHAGDGSAS
ncbi:MAG: ABC transporter ATP-binding protein [Acidimicrobiia bacterium]